MSKKLEKVLEYLINNQEDKAKELLHQVFIEKARAIHEELINMEDEEMEMEADQGDDLMNEIGHGSDELDELSNEIESEETMAEADDEMDLDMADAESDLVGAEDDMADAEGDMADAEDDMMDMGDMDSMGDMDDAENSDEMSDIDSKMDKLEDIIDSLRAEFDALSKAADSSDDSMDDMDNMDDMDDAGDLEMDDEDSDSEDADADDEKMDESWLAEFDDLEESVSLENVPAPNEKEVGAGKYASVETNTKSPVAKAPNEMFGAKPVVTGKGPTKSGYERESAPTAQQMKGVKDNRRKKAEDGMTKVSKEGDGAAMLNKSQGEPNKKSPLTNSPRK